MKCKRCGSYAINPNRHGRTGKNSGDVYYADLNLCDVCFWRKRAEEQEELLRDLIGDWPIDYSTSNALEAARAYLKNSC